MPRVVRDGVTIAYGDSDAGAEREPVLVIPGLGGSRLMWAPVTAVLERTMRVIAVDPRGAGESDASPGPYDAEDLARDVAAVLDHAQVERCAVFGLSMGGMIAQHLAAAHASRVSRLALVCTYARPDEWARRCFRLRLKLLDRVGLVDQLDLAALLTTSPGTMRRHASLFDGAPSPSPADLADLAGYRGQLALCAAHDGRPVLGDIRCPTLVISAAEDLLTTARQGRELADGIAGARYVEVDEASHGLIWERPAELTELLLTFLDQEASVRHA